MRLVVDTSVLVGELLREKGRRRIQDDRLELYLPEAMHGEVAVELPRRIRAFGERRGLRDVAILELVDACLGAVGTNLVVVEAAVYTAFEQDARWRSARDPRDWPLVGCAVALNAAIWTNDNDLLGTGVATWATETLTAWLDRHPEG